MSHSTHTSWIYNVGVCDKMSNNCTKRVKTTIDQCLYQCHTHWLVIFYSNPRFHSHFISNKTVLYLTLKVSKLAVSNPVRLWTRHRWRCDQRAAPLQATAAPVSRELLPRDGRCAAGSGDPWRRSAGSEDGFLQECNTHRAADLQREEACSSASCWPECGDDTWHWAWGKTAHQEGTAESPYLFLRPKNVDKMRCFLRHEKSWHNDLMISFTLRFNNRHYVIFFFIFNFLFFILICVKFLPIFLNICI